MNKSTTCMFTGHRDISGEALFDILSALDRLLEELIQRGYTDFCAGGAIGFDTIASLKVIEKKKKYNLVKLHLCLPCRDQAKGWSDALKGSYEFIKANADSISYAEESYTRGCMHKRNREMVELSSVCVAYCKKNSGGTYYTLQYARKKGLEIREL